MNRLYYGDDLDVLRRHVEDGSVDLIYLDPRDQSGNRWTSTRRTRISPF